MRKTCLFLRRGGVAAALVDGGLFRRGEAGHVAARESEAASARVRGRHVDELRSTCAHVRACSINLSGLLTRIDAPIAKLQGGTTGYDPEKKTPVLCSSL